MNAGVGAKQQPLLARRVKRWLRRWEIGAGGLVAAVSGGPDSVALLRALIRVRPPAENEPLVIAHLNHRLRGDESDADAAFVTELHRVLSANYPGLHLRLGSLDVAAVARAEHGNLEATARRKRYEWLTRIAQETGARWVATGHTADDQAETVLHRLLRGAGLKGLRGIAARRPLATGVDLVRPVLSVTRAEVLAFLEDEGQAYRVDRSNTDLSFTRNRLRHQLLPHLARDFNPGIASVLCRLARQADEAYRLVEEQAAKLLLAAERPRAGNLLIFERATLAAAPRRLVCEMLRLLWTRELWPTARMSFAAWERLAEVAQGMVTGVDLPGHIRARCLERVVQLERSE
jgi:tRNA(Ile)-lysidine synthase